jgi:hypothetical protein
MLNNHGGGTRPVGTIIECPNICGIEVYRLPAWAREAMGLNERRYQPEEPQPVRRGFTKIF